jgi:hypothetical protein
MFCAVYPSILAPNFNSMSTLTTDNSKHVKPLEPRFEMGWFKSGEVGASIQSDGDFTVTGKVRF